jgi:hypothetical protein
MTNRNYYAGYNAHKGVTNTWQVFKFKTKEERDQFVGADEENRESWTLKEVKQYLGKSNLEEIDNTDQYGNTFTEVF